MPQIIGNSARGLGCVKQLIPSGSAIAKSPHLGVLLCYCWSDFRAHELMCRLGHVRSTKMKFRGARDQNIVHESYGARQGALIF